MGESIEEEEKKWGGRECYKIKIKEPPPLVLARNEQKSARPNSRTNF